MLFSAVIFLTAVTSLLSHATPVNPPVNVTVTPWIISSTSSAAAADPSSQPQTACSPDLCLSKWYYCGTGPAFCGQGCRSGPCFVGTSTTTTVAPNASNLTVSTSGSRSTSGPSGALVTAPNIPINVAAKCVVYTENFDTPQPLHFSVDYCTDHFMSQDGQGILRMDQTCGTRISSLYYFNGGYFEATLKVGRNTGVVTSFILRSDEAKPSDEVDFEFVGKNPFYTQTNFFLNSVEDFKNAVWYKHGYDASQQYLKVAFSWGSDRIQWLINDRVVQTWNKADGKGFPNKPMRVQIGLWDGTKTSGWAGTTDFSQGPFYVHVDSVTMKASC